MTEKLYFAYGSNMLGSRLRERVGNYYKLGVAELPNYSFDYSKPNEEGTAGYGNVTHALGKRTLGVLYSLNLDQILKLDEFEGTPEHYERTELGLFHQSTLKVADVYVGTTRQHDLKPEQWYLDLVIRGAKENYLPESYIKQLRRGTK